MDSVDTKPSPLETHRFHLNEHSVKELDTFRDHFKQYKSEHPEVIGGVLYGSHVVGFGRDANSPEGRSDVDMWFYIDADKAGLDSTGKKTSPEKDDTKERELIKSLGEPLRQKIKDMMEYADEDVEHVRARILSKERIDNELDAVIDWNKKWESRNDPSSTVSSRELLDNVQHTSLGNLFNLQIGGRDLDPYRAYVLAKLKDAGSIGEKVWLDMLSTARMFESGRVSNEVNQKRTENNLYPQTVQDAISVYQLTGVAPKYQI